MMYESVLEFAQALHGPKNQGSGARPIYLYTWPDSTWNRVL